MVATEAARFRASGYVTLDASGNGVVRLAPTGTKWKVESTSVKCAPVAPATAPVNEAQCRVYSDNIGDTFIADNGTYAGSTGDTSDTVHYVEDGHALYFVWTGGDAGAVATVTINGWQSVDSGGFRAVH